jgi:hypothetical protein
VDFKVSPPVTYVIPSRVVAEALRLSHLTWLKNPGKGDRPHNDTPMRQVKWAYTFPVAGHPPEWLERWRERWELIGFIVGEAQEAGAGSGA